MVFFAPLGVLFIMKTLEDEQYVGIKYKFRIFEILRVCFVIYCVSVLSLHIESINSVIRATVHLCSFAESMYRLDNTMLAMCTISRCYQRYVEDNKPPCQSYGSGLHAVSLQVTTKLTRSIPESIG